LFISLEVSLLQNPEKWPKNHSGIYPKNVLKISGFTSINPIKTKKLLKNSKTPIIYIKKKLGDLW